MNTAVSICAIETHIRSDSSMVDEYLWVVVGSLFITSSDSSMVDEYSHQSQYTMFSLRVQIPLWSMNTSCPSTQKFSQAEFRFLYGRWIRWTLWRTRERPPWFRFLYGRWIQKLACGLTADIKVFRFLYGRWIRRHHCEYPARESCSDSSMVDEYALAQWSSEVLRKVQIPLWSMNTSAMSETGHLGVLFRFLYGRWIRPHGSTWKASKAGSDSSMVDEYWNYNYWTMFFSSVQIPLWSMNTTAAAIAVGALVCSDSSMVDEYRLHHWISKRTYVVQIPLWSMNTADAKTPLLTMQCSDSSMVDEYPSGFMTSWCGSRVQIPLWSMNTLQKQE